MALRPKETAPPVPTFNSPLGELSMTPEEMWRSSFLFHSNIKRMGSFVLRKYPEDDTLKDCVDFKTAADHFQALSDFGMNIVPFSYFPDDNQSTGYCVSRLIPDTTAAINVPATKLRRMNFVDKVQVPLQKYRQWLIDTEQTRYLYDIFSTRQYSIHTKSQTPFLHDIDPYTQSAYPHLLKISIARINYALEDSSLSPQRYNLPF